MQKRREASRPHPTYDIDGDGQVSHKDYFFSKLFDKDKKGFLTDEERKACQKALLIEHFDDNFVFGLENKLVSPDSKDQAVIRDRVVQFQGKLIQQEDYTVLTHDVTAPLDNVGSLMMDENQPS